LNVEPSAGGCPPGRYSLLDEVNWPNLFALSLSWLRNWASTGKPLSATSAPVRSALDSGRLPHRFAASCQVAMAPGTPAEMPLTRASSKTYGWPVSGLMNAFSCMLIGAVSRPSML
jgi:hypothetical protein